MDFQLSQDQKLLAETAASFAQKSSPVSRFRKLRDDPLGWDPAVWRQMGELGWLALPLPEAAGGFGGSFVDVCILLEKLATTLVPEPYLSSVVLAGMTLGHAGTAEQHERWLAPMLEGRSTIALAWAERDARYDPTRVATRAERTGDAWRLSGEKCWVLDGHHASQFVVSAVTDDGLALFVVDRGAPGTTVTPTRTIDGRRAAFVRLDGATVADDARLGAPGTAGRLLDRVLDGAAVAACAEGLGICQTVLDMTVGYLKTREQFGVKIGTFQVLQHRAVDMFVQVELARSLTTLAAVKVGSDDDDERRKAVSAAKIQLSSGGSYVVRQAIQLHGGIGVTDEHDVGLYFKRLVALNALFGDEEDHVARFAARPGFSTTVC